MTSSLPVILCSALKNGLNGAIIDSPYKGPRLAEVLSTRFPRRPVFLLSAYELPADREDDLYAALLEAFEFDGRAAPSTGERLAQLASHVAAIAEFNDHASPILVVESGRPLTSSEYHWLADLQDTIAAHQATLSVLIIAQHELTIAQEIGKHSHDPLILARFLPCASIKPAQGFSNTSAQPKAPQRSTNAE